MVKKMFTDQEPVSRSFLLKTVLSMVGSFIVIIVAAFQFGGIFAQYEKLSEIPVSDIRKAVTYAVDEKDARKDFYRNWMNSSDINIADHEKRISIIEGWQREVKQDIKDIKTAVMRIDSNLKRD